jgi:glycosyltransferase involved in cell wall biosynthesis
MPNSEASIAKPKLLLYTHGLVDGGAERLWACLATALKKRGYPVVFVQDFEATDNRSNLDPDIRVHTLGRNHILATRRLSAILKAEKPAVALSAVGGSNLKLMLALAMAGTDTKPILTYHGFNEWRTGLLSFATYFGLPVLSARAARIVAVSAGLQEQLIRKWGAKAEQTTCIHNPVFYPSKISTPTTGQLAQRENIILSVGRFVVEKDYLTLIRAFARVRVPDAKLIILGKGPLHAKMEAEIARLGLQDRVSLPGYSPEPWKSYGAAKCFVSSSNSEPFGNVVVEAMAYGLPVVATACDGPQEILSHGVYGRITSIGDHVQLAHAIEATLQDPGDPAIRVARARDFSFPVRIPAYEALIAEVMGTALRDPAHADLANVMPFPTPNAQPRFVARS